MSPEFYEAKSAFDSQLLSSIPKKVKHWLQLLGMDIQEGKYDLLEWSFTRKVITLRSENPLEDSFTIMWEGKTEYPDYIFANEKWVTDISHNLVRFVKLEKQIYDILENLDEEIQLAKRNI